MMHPANPVAAATHPNPYRYYAALARERSLRRDDALGFWVASSAEAVTAVLASPLCWVRPPNEPVPKALLGSTAGDVFRHLVRMDDGVGHCLLKRALSGTLALLDQRHVGDISRRWAAALSAPLAAVPKPGELTRFMFDLPVYVVGILLGIPEAALPRLALLTGSFVGCLASTGSPEQIESGKVAAAELLDLFRSHLADHRFVAGDNLLAAFAREVKRTGREDLSVVAANAIGLLSQAYEATAGLIGNTLLVLARDAGLRRAVHDDKGALEGIVNEVSRCDPSIQNTRRWAAEAGIVANQSVEAGDGILIVLAAANRDPSVNPDPDRFDPSRQDRRCFTFGAGVHACPGERLAAAVAVAGVGRMIVPGQDLGFLAGPVSYRASANARIPFL